MCRDLRDREWLKVEGEKKFQAIRGEGGILALLKGDKPPFQEPGGDGQTLPSSRALTHLAEQATPPDAPCTARVGSPGWWARPRIASSRISPQEDQGVRVTYGVGRSR